MSDYEEGFVTRLTNFGLNEKEARVYYHLLRRGASSVTELTAATKDYRVAAYRVLESLTDKGLIETSIGKPRVFAAVPLSIALHLIIQRRRTQLAHMESAQAEFLEYANPARLALETAEGTCKVRLISGGSDILTTAAQMIDRARQTTLAIMRPHTMPALALSGMLDAYRRAVERGVAVRIITDVVPNNVRAVQVVTDVAAVRCRHEHMGLLFWTVDATESMTVITASHARAIDRTDSAFWISNPSYTTYLASTFDMVWDQSIAFEARMKQIHKQVLSMETPPPSHERPVHT